MPGGVGLGPVRLDSDRDGEIPGVQQPLGRVGGQRVAPVERAPGYGHRLIEGLGGDCTTELGTVRFVAAENITDAEQPVVDDLALQQHPPADGLSDVESLVDSLTDWSSGFERLLVPVDIDVLDGALFPIAGNTRTVPGLPLAVLGRLLDGLCHLPNFVALTPCEVNPDHARNGQTQLASLIEMLAQAFGARGEFGQ